MTIAVGYMGIYHSFGQVLRERQANEVRFAIDHFARTNRLGQDVVLTSWTVDGVRVAHKYYSGYLLREYWLDDAIDIDSYPEIANYVEALKGASKLPSGLYIVVAEFNVENLSIQKQRELDNLVGALSRMQRIFLDHLGRKV